MSGHPDKEGTACAFLSEMANTRPAIKCDFGFAMARHKQHHRDSPPGGSQRQLRVGELVRHALAEMLTRGDVHDPVIERHMITIPEVRVSADKIDYVVNGMVVTSTPKSAVTTDGIYGFRVNHAMPENMITGLSLTK